MPYSNRAIGGIVGVSRKKCIRESGVHASMHTQRHVCLVVHGQLLEQVCICERGIVFAGVSGLRSWGVPIISTYVICSILLRIPVWIERG